MTMTKHSENWTVIEKHFSGSERVKFEIWIDEPKYMIDLKGNSYIGTIGGFSSGSVNRHKFDERQAREIYEALKKALPWIDEKKKEFGLK